MPWDERGWGKGGIYDLRSLLQKGKLGGAAPFNCLVTSGMCFTRQMLSTLLPMPTEIKITSDDYLKYAAMGTSTGYMLIEKLSNQRLHGNNAYTGRDKEQRLQGKILLQTAYAAFINSVEFCGWPIDSIFEEAYRDISLYFESKRGKPLSASAIAIDLKTRVVIATALITDKKEQGACLGLLYVRPSYQRKGIGTHIIHRSILMLAQQGYSQLASRYHICNHHSRQFYHSLGFQDVRDRYYLRTYTAWLGNEIYRRKHLKMLDGIEEIKQEQKQLQKKLEALEEEFLQSTREVVEKFKLPKP